LVTALSEKKYEDRAVVLDILIQGHPNDPRPVHLREPVLQVLGDTFFTMLEVVPLPGATFVQQEQIYIGKKAREKVERIRRRIGYEELTTTAKTELAAAIQAVVVKSPERFIDFFNRAGPLTTRFHQLELVPGIGKKLMWAILEEREKGLFADFKDLEKRVKGLSNPGALVAKRIEMELEGADKYSIFVRAPSKKASEEEL
jgi:putative nucleotide binding protein